MSKEFVRTTIAIPTELRRELDDVATQMDLSTSEYMRLAIIAALRNGMDRLVDTGIRRNPHRTTHRRITVDV